MNTKDRLYLQKCYPHSETAIDVAWISIVSFCVIWMEAQHSFGGDWVRLNLHTNQLQRADGDLIAFVLQNSHLRAIKLLHYSYNTVILVILFFSIGCVLLSDTMRR